MRKLSSAIAVAALTLATIGLAGGVANAAPKAPNNFVLMTEAWSNITVIRLWYNTANGGIHAEITDDNTANGFSPANDYSVDIEDLNGNVLASNFGSTPPVNTKEVFTAQSIKACGGQFGYWCTGNT